MVFDDLGSLLHNAKHPFLSAFFELWIVEKQPCPKHKRKCNGLNYYNGNCIGFNGNYNSVYWYVMDSIGGMFNPIGKMPKTLHKLIL